MASVRHCPAALHQPQWLDSVTLHSFWQGFLSARLSFLELIGFGLSLFAKSSNEARLNLLVKGLPGLLGMLLGLTRTVGYEDRLLGKRQRQ